MEDKTRPGPLSCYRILDLTDEKGHFCAKILGDLGADVIKIEPVQGDAVRLKPPFYQDRVRGSGSLSWYGFNTNKRGITLNIETRDGREIFKRLVKGADFVIESFPPDYMDGLGLGYDVLKTLNRRIIMTSITPYGRSGPYKHWQGTDLTYMAMSTMMTVSGDPDRPPLRISVDTAYPLAASQAAAGTMIAHYHRLKTGRGQHVDLSVQEAIGWAVAKLVSDWKIRKLYPPSHQDAVRQGSRVMRGVVAPRIIWPCKDGYVAWRIFTGVMGRRTQAMSRWMIREGMGKEVEDIIWEEYDFNQLTQEQLERWEGSFEVFFMTKTKKELHEWSVQEGMTLYPVSTTRDIAENSQLRARDFWVSLRHPEPGAELTYPGRMYKSSAYEIKPTFPAPLPGEHNESIYGDELGLTRENLAALSAANVL